MHGEKAWCNYTRMMWAILNKSWRQHPTKQQLYGHLQPITKTVQVRTRHRGNCWKISNGLHNWRTPVDPLTWRAKAGHPARTYIQKLSADTGCSLETYREWWTIERGGGRGPGRSLQMVRHDDILYIYIYIYIYIGLW